MQKASQRIRTYDIKMPNNATTEDIIRVVNAIKSGEVINPTQHTYQVRRSASLPIFRMFIPKKSNNITNIYKDNIFGKNIFRLFGN